MIETSPRSGGQHLVHLLGPFALVRADGQPLDGIPAGRASLLLQRLAVAAGATISVDLLVDALWPDKAPTSASRTVASLVSRIRSSADPSAISGNANRGYRFNLGPSWTTDVVLIERLIDEAHSRSANAPALAAASAHRGLTLLERGKPLNDERSIDAIWIDEFVRHVDGLRRKLQRELWEADAKLGRWDELVDQAEAALEIEPHDEAAGRTLMTAHWNRGDRGSALRVHDLLRASLVSELGVEPSSDTEALYTAIVRDEHVSAITKQQRPPTAPSDIRLAGRNTELNQLVQSWNTAAADRAGSVVISGPLGSGKTNLCSALADIVERTGGRVLWSESAEGERSLFLHPLLSMITNVVLSTPAEDIPDLLGPFLGTAAELIPELREVCSIDAYQRASADLEHRRALQTIAHIISKLAARHPVLMIFDDLHHAGASTYEALLWLRHELRDQPVLVIATVQSDHGDARLSDFAAQSTNIALRPVSRTSVAELAAQAGFASNADFVWELTQGHLLFVKSVLAALSRDVPKEEIASSLGSVVLDSVRQVGTDVQNMLAVASVIGITFDLETLSNVSEREPSELIELLELALAASLVEVRDDHFAFSNRVIQEVLYESILSPVRRQRHRRLAEISTGHPERRAWHLDKAGLAGKAALAWLEAARRAQRAFSNTDAERLFSAAIRSANMADNQDCRGDALIGRGNARTELGDYHEASMDHLEAERLALSTGNRQLRARAVERLGWVAYYERDVTVAIARAEEATTMSGAHPSAWVLLGRTRHWAGDFAQATAAYNRALTELDPDETMTRASALSCLGALLAHSDKYQEAIEILDESVALCHEIGAFRPLLRSLFFEGLARANVGDLAGALTTFETKNTLLHRYDVSFYRARTNTCLAWIWRELGDHQRSRALSEQALRESREIDEGELQVEQELHALCSLAECAVIDGHPDHAAELLASAQVLLGQWLPFRWRAELRVVEISSRIRIESPERLLNDARERGSAKYEALALHLLQRSAEAGRVAATTGSSLLMAEVAEPDRASAAAAQLSARLPRQLRVGFETQGRLARIRPHGYEP